MLGQCPPPQAHTVTERDPTALKSLQYITDVRQRRHFSESPAVRVSALYRFQWTWNRGFWTFAQCLLSRQESMYWTVSKPKSEGLRWNESTEALFTCTKCLQSNQNFVSLKKSKTLLHDHKIKQSDIAMPTHTATYGPSIFRLNKLGFHWIVRSSRRRRFLQLGVSCCRLLVPLLSAKEAAWLWNQI